MGRATLSRADGGGAARDPVEAVRARLFLDGGELPARGGGVTRRQLDLRAQLARLDRARLEAEARRLGDGGVELARRLRAVAGGEMNPRRDDHRVEARPRVLVFLRQLDGARDLGVGRGELLARERDARQLDARLDLVV